MAPDGIDMSNPVNAVLFALVSMGVFGLMVASVVSLIRKAIFWAKEALSYRADAPPNPHL